MESCRLCIYEKYSAISEGWGFDASAKSKHPGQTTDFKGRQFPEVQGCTT